MKYVSVKYKVILFFACFFVIDLAIAQNNETDSNKVSFGYNYNLPEWMITRSVSKVDASILDKIHRKKIDISDAIYVVNIDGYIGDSTKKEIEYAKNKGKAYQS